MLVGLACPLEVKGQIVCQAQLHQRPRHLVQLLLFFEQGKRPAVVAARLLAGIGQAGLVASLQQVLDRLFALSRQLIVPGDQPQVLADPLPGSGLQPACYLSMVHPAQIQQHRLVGHIPQQRMLKDVLLRAGKGRTLPPEDQLPITDSLKKGGDFLPIEFPSLLCPYLSHGRVPKHPPHHCGSLQKHLFLGWQTVQPGLEHPSERGRYVYPG